MLFRRFLLSAVLVIPFFVFGAQQASALALEPALSDISVSPGTAHDAAIMLTNDEPDTATYYLSIQKFVARGEEGQQEFLPMSDTTGLPSWIFVNQPSLTLQPGEKQRVPFTIRVPEQAIPGGYYVALFFSSVPPVLSPQGMVVVGSKVGALLLVTVEGGSVSSWRVVDHALGMPSSVSHLPAAFDLTIENRGNVHVVPEGTITIKNMFGSIVARLPLQRNQPRVLPSSRRHLLLTWQKEKPNNAQGFFGRVHEEWNNFAIGPYTAYLETANKEVTENIEWRFSVWPWRLLICLLIGLFAFLIVMSLYRRWVLRRVIA